MKKTNLILLAFFAAAAMAVTACGNNTKSKKRTSDTAAAAVETPDGGTNKNQALEIPTSSVQMDLTGGEISVSIIKASDANEKGYIETKYSGDIGTLLGSSPRDPDISEVNVYLDNTGDSSLPPLMVSYSKLQTYGEQLLVITYFGEGSENVGDILLFGRALIGGEPVRLLSDEGLMSSIRTSSGLNSVELRDRIEDYLARYGLAELGDFAGIMANVDPR